MRLKLSERHQLVLARNQVYLVRTERSKRPGYGFVTYYPFRLCWWRPTGNVRLGFQFQWKEPSL